MRRDLRSINLLVSQEKRRRCCFQIIPFRSSVCGEKKMSAAEKGGAAGIRAARVKEGKDVVVLLYRERDVPFCFCLCPEANDEIVPAAFSLLKMAVWSARDLVLGEALCNNVLPLVSLGSNYFVVLLLAFFFQNPNFWLN